MVDDFAASRAFFARALDRLKELFALVGDDFEINVAALRMGEAHHEALHGLDDEALLQVRGGWFTLALTARTFFEDATLVLESRGVAFPDLGDL